MKLYFKGHDERYAVEQTLLNLYPEEKPLYPEDPPSGDNELTLSFSPGKTWYTATAVLRRDGKTFRHQARVPAPKEGASAVLTTRLRRRCLQKAFYLASVDHLGTEPPWGMLSGVRPVKLPVRAVLAGNSLAQAKDQLRKVYRVSPQKLSLAMDCAKAALVVKQSLQPNEVSLYVGIPFCPSRCTYCSFISAYGQNNKLMEPYLEALHQEIAAASEGVQKAGLTIRSVYIGGGTPTTLSAQQLTDLIQALRNAFSLEDGLEFTVEAGRPDTITKEKLLALRQGGVNRISLNPQSMSDEVLTAIGRDHTAEDIRRCLPLIRSMGFSTVNMDLIAGLPKDDFPGFQTTLEEILSLRPENITVHTLALKKGANLTRDEMPLPGADVVTHMLDFAWQRLGQAGYRPYYLYRQKFMSGSLENVGWCLPGHESLYNIAMMEELQSILSLGAGAVSKAVNYEKGHVQRLVNPKYPQEYMSALSRIAEDKCALSHFGAQEEDFRVCHTI